ncbi:serine/threonine-protein kinase [Nocardia arthritidis]|uniref:serine/threonine-protein kinase n=1 Tax=Nocardia arthritidis TaxID=228602 RepID=UPI00142DA2CD|nr:serine/threonine-protein kinase [Nocardia arthritidis]
MTESIEWVRRALPGYEVGGELGRGGCGVVLAGKHRRLGRPVAIKQIPPQFAHDELVRRRFVAEARVMAAIDHPHVARVFDYVEQDELCLLVLEYLPGGTVADRFATAGFDTAAAVAVALAAAAGLAAAHRQRVLHRDVKPANLIFAAGGAIKLTDFGIAKIVGGDETLVTKAGDIVGTPAYIAPEQARGEALSPATDVYALATMLYQLLSGVLPFPSGGGPLAMLFAHAYDEPRRLGEVAPTVPEPIADAVMRGLATDPAQRFATAEAFGIALAEPAAWCWGGDWLGPVGIPVIGADTIIAAATGGYRGGAPITPAPRPGPRPPQPFTTTASGSVVTPPPVGPPAPATVAFPSGMPPESGNFWLPRTPQQLPSPPGADPVGTPGRQGTSAVPGRSGPQGAPVGGQRRLPPTHRVRPAEALADNGIRLIEVDRRDLVPIREVVTFDSPRVPFGSAAVLAVASVAAALIGIGGPATGGDLAPGTVAVAEVDPVSTEPIRVDLSQRIPLRVNGLDVDSGALRLRILGLSVGADPVPIRPGTPATLAAPVNRYVIAGMLPAELSLRRNGTEVATQRLRLRSTQPPTTTATAVGVVVLALFALAYIESNMRVLRRGRGGFANSVGLMLSAALLAVALVGAAWILLDQPATVATVAVSAALAAAAGLATSFGARRIGKRYRYLRRIRLRVRRPAS